LITAATTSANESEALTPNLKTKGFEDKDEDPMLISSSAVYLCKSTAKEAKRMSKGVALESSSTVEADVEAAERDSDNCKVAKAVFSEMDLMTSDSTT
jgi:hypothetical protein